MFISFKRIIYFFPNLRITKHYISCVAKCLFVLCISRYSMSFLRALFTTRSIMVLNNNIVCFGLCTTQNARSAQLRTYNTTMNLAEFNLTLRTVLPIRIIVDGSFWIQTTVLLDIFHVVEYIGLGQTRIGRLERNLRKISTFIMFIIS